MMRMSGTMPVSARAFSRAKVRPGSSLSSRMKTRWTPQNHLFNSGVQLPAFLLFGLVAPSQLVAAEQNAILRRKILRPDRIDHREKMPARFCASMRLRQRRLTGAQARHLGSNAVQLEGQVRRPGRVGG